MLGETPLHCHPHYLPMPAQKSLRAVNKAFEFLFRRFKNQRNSPSSLKQESFLHHLHPENIFQIQSFLEIFGSSNRLSPGISEMNSENCASASEAAFSPLRDLAQSPE